MPYHKLPNGDTWWVAPNGVSHKVSEDTPHPTDKWKGALSGLAGASGLANSNDFMAALTGDDTFYTDTPRTSPFKRPEAKPKSLEQRAKEFILQNTDLSIKKMLVTFTEHETQDLRAADKLHATKAKAYDALARNFDKLKNDFAQYKQSNLELSDVIIELKAKLAELERQHQEIRDHAYVNTRSGRRIRP